MSEIVEALRQLVPVRIEAVWGMITGAVGVAAEILFGAWSDALAALVVAMLIDYVSGVIAAYINPALSLNSQRGFRGILKKIMILLIRGYQIFISPLFPKTCRFYPTCSTYFIQALEKYGFFKGSYLGIRRLLKCHPFNPGGYDPLK